MKMIDKIKSFFKSFILRWKTEELLIKTCNRSTPLHRKVSILISFIFLVITIIVCLCSFPSSAEDGIAPLSDVPTDLTGYIWTCTSTECNASFGSYEVYGIVLSDGSIDYPFGDEDIYTHTLYIGYRWSPDTDITSTPNSLVYMPQIASISPGYVIQFTRGPDITNLELISWLSSHGTLQLNNGGGSDPNPLVPFNKGLYRVNALWYNTGISSQLDGLEFYSLNEGDLYTSLSVQNDELIFEEENGVLQVMARYTTTGAKWLQNSGQFVYFINDESIPQSLAEQIPTLLEYIPDVSLTDFQCMQDSWYYGILDGYSGGYNQATNDTQGTFLGNIFGGVFDALDKFQMFGQFSFLDFIKSIIGILALIWFLKLLAGG